MDQSVDLIIAGAGLAGLLSLKHLSAQHPNWKIVLLEREGRIGGRLRASRPGSWSCGLQGIGPELFDYVSGLVPQGIDTVLRPLGRAGVLSGQKISDFPFAQFSSSEMARALGGAAAAREWSHVEELFDAIASDDQSPDQSFAQAWKADRKSAALVVFEHLAHVWGYPELNPAPVRELTRRALQFRRGLWSGPWEDLFGEFTGENPDRAPHVETVCGAQIMAARYEDKEWAVATTRGAFRAPKLLVAQSPWEAIAWLPKDLWPNSLLNLTSKAKSVSLLILSDKLLAPEPGLPDLLLVPAEDVQVYHSDNQLVFQATLNFELTVQAPVVVKAVKRLKRAKKKVQAALPSLQISEEGDHIALLPVGWAHAATPQEQRWFDKVDPQTIQKPHLAYCGDAYGGESHSDLNLIASVEAVRKIWHET